MRADDPIFFITPDPVLGVGLSTFSDNFHVICLENPPLAEMMRQRGQKVFCLKEHVSVEDLPRTSRHLLSHPETLRHIQKNSNGGKANLLFFKFNFDLDRLWLNTPPFDYQVLNVPFALSRQFEDKISFARFLPEEFGLPYQVTPLLELDYQEMSIKMSERLVLQFPSGHAGEHTFFINSRAGLDSLRAQYPQKEMLVKVTPYVEGPTLTVNACVSGERVATSFPFLQITGLPFLTPYRGGTCGTIWDEAAVPKWALSPIQEMTADIGRKMNEKGFKGWFGLDFLIDVSAQRVYVVECNPRLTASVSMFTQLEKRSSNMSLLDLHLAEFLGHSAADYKPSWLRGSQVILRNVISGPFTMHSNRSMGIDLNSIETISGYALVAREPQSEILPGKEILRLQSLEPYLFLTSQLETTPLLNEVLSSL